jgi:hypothetical protein
MQVEIKTDEVLQQAQQFTKDISIPEILTEEDYIIAVTSRRTVKDRLKELKKQRETVTKPLHEVKTNFIALLKPFKDKLELYLTQLDPRIIKWDDKVKEKIRQEEDRLRKEQEKEAERLRKRAGNAKKDETKERLEEEAELIEATPAIVLPPKKVEGMHFMEIFDFVIEDEALIPNEYKIVDTVKIRKVVKATKGTLPIKGIKIISKKVPVSKN